MKRTLAMLTIAGTLMATPSALLAAPSVSRPQRPARVVTTNVNTNVTNNTNVNTNANNIGIAITNVNWNQNTNNNWNQNTNDILLLLIASQQAR